MFLQQEPRYSPAFLTLASLVALVIACFVAWLYSPALSFQYVWDDNMLFLDNNLLRSGWASIRNVAMPILPGSTYFRPVVLSSFVAEFALFDAVPLVSHLINIALHVVNTMLVFCLARRLVRATAERTASPAAPVITWVSALAALFYGTHPALMESAAWVAGRFDLAVVTFSLALLLYVARNQPIAGWRAALLLLSALFCKEMAITLPMIAFFIRCHVVGEGQSFGAALRREKKLLAWMVAATTLYMLCRILAFPSLIHLDRSVQAILPTLFAKVSFVAQTLFFYLSAAAYPYPQTQPFHGWDFATVGNISIGNSLRILEMLTLTGLSAWAVINMRVRSFIWISALISLLPVLNLIPLTIGGSIGENRFLTLPLVLVATAIATELYRLTNLQNIGFKRVSLIAVGGLSALLVFANVMFVRLTLPVWRSDLALFSWTSEQYPDQGEVASRYLAAAYNSSLLTGSLEHVKVALRRIRERPAPLVLSEGTRPALAGAYWLIGDRAEAYSQLEAGLRSNVAPVEAKFQDARLLTLFLQDTLDREQSMHALAAAEQMFQAFGDRRYEGQLYPLRARQAMLNNELGKYRQALADFSSKVPLTAVANEVRALRVIGKQACSASAIPAQSPFCRADFSF